MEILRVLTYLSGVVFVVAFAIKVIKYFAMPMHVRWELYPIPHEGKPYGGSFFEDVDYWKKARHKDHFAQYRFMIPEILFIRALREDNRSLWYWSFPFHFGLYCALGGLIFLVIGALLQIGGYAPSSSVLAALAQAVTMVLAFVGFVLGAIGAVGLIVKRTTDQALLDQSAPIDYFNLIWLTAIFVTGFLVGISDLGFTKSREFLAGLISLKELPQLGALQVINLLLFIGFWAYFPFTHMTHMVSKYFMWDKVKWDDDPNVGDAGVDAKIKKYLAYPVTWSAAHVGAEGGKKSWADIATTNPWAKPEKEQE
jgi:nitrate reductase gamma subunit